MKPPQRGQRPRGESPDRLPPSRAFLVQLPAGDLGNKPGYGRVEHVQTGRSTRFDGLEELAQFFAEVLANDEGREQGARMSGWQPRHRVNNAGRR